MNCNPKLQRAVGAGMKDVELPKGRVLWSATAASLRPASPDTLPVSAVSAREPDGAHAIPVLTCKNVAGEGDENRTRTISDHARELDGSGCPCAGHPLSLLVAAALGPRGRRVQAREATRVSGLGLDSADSAKIS